MKFFHFGCNMSHLNLLHTQVLLTLLLQTFFFYFGFLCVVFFFCVLTCKNVYLYADINGRNSKLKQILLCVNFALVINYIIMWQFCKLISWYNSTFKRCRIIVCTSEFLFFSISLLCTMLCYFTNISFLFFNIICIHIHFICQNIKLKTWICLKIARLFWVWVRHRIDIWFWFMMNI